MYFDHFGLTEPPFTITPHTEFFFAGANRGATLEALIYAITHGEGIVKVSGEVGSGKTMLCRVLMERLPETVETIYLAIPSLKRDEMLAAICGDLGVTTPGSAPNALVTGALLKGLQEHLLRLHAEGRRVVALIDEAHAMPLDSLEEIRLLSNLETNKAKLLQIVLFGQPELDENLAKPQMRQLRERITHSFRLSALTLDDVRDYLRHRLRAAGYKGAEVFGPNCVKLIAKASAGLTRRINIIADKSLLAAYSDNTHTVTRAHVRAAIGDSEFAATTRRTGPTPWAIAVALAAGVSIGALSAGWLTKRDLQGSRLRPASGEPAVARARPQEAVAVPAAPPGVPAAAEVPSAGKAPTAPAAQPTATASPVLASARTATPASAPAAGTLMISSAWLNEEPAANWVVQLMLANAGETAELRDFIQQSEQAVGNGLIHAYPLTVRGIQKVSVVYGSFASQDEAQQALDALPPRVRQFKPYLRSVLLIRNEAQDSDKRPAGVRGAAVQGESQG